MQLINADGFSVDLETRRVYLVEGKFVGFIQGIPNGVNNITIGSDHGEIVQKLKKIVINSNNNLLYVDIAGKPYKGTIQTWESLPHDEQGRLIVDTVGKITSEVKGLGITEFGGVAMLPDQNLKAPILNNVYPAKNTIVLDFDPTEGKEATLYTGYASGGGKVYTAEVYDPDEDLAIQGLTEGVIYECYVTATYSGKESLPSNKISTTCKTVIPAPIFKSCKAGDGFASVEYSDVVAPEPWKIDHYAYSAINMDDKTAPEVEGHIENGRIALPNDINWYVRICAVCNPGRVPGDFSDALTVTPEHPSVPYAPVINTCFVSSNGQITTKWSKGSNGNHSASANIVDLWKVKFKSADGKGTDFEKDMAANVTEYVSDKVSIGTWEITVLAHNDNGWSQPSRAAAIDYKPTVNDPLVGGTSFQDDTYKYCLFYSGATTGYEALRTKEGELVEFEVLMVGAGGAGKGQTLTFGKGGDGGGGELVITKLPPASAGSIFVTVPSGGSINGENPADTTVKEYQTVLTAKAGKSANDKNNAAGYPKQEVPLSWQRLQMFWWLEPGSHYVGGAAQSGEQNYPNATFCGEAGAGTKENRGGVGKESFVAIRWKK